MYDWLIEIEKLKYLLQCANFVDLQRKLC
ncbi:Protein of unknown function [Bacillus wiedmannii]|nr:Protein of unknown function [Bacillus wiedmannii]